MIDDLWPLTDDIWPLTTAALLLAATGFLAYRQLRAYLLDLEAVRVRAQAKPIIDRRIEHLAGRMGLAELAPILAEDLTNRETSALVLDRRGRPIGSAPPHEGPAPPLLSFAQYQRTLEGDKHVTYLLSGQGGRRLLVVLVPPKTWLPRPPAIVQLTIDLTPLHRVLRTFVLTLFGAGLAVLAGALVLGEVLGGPYELLSLAAVPLVAILAARARRPREDGVSPAQQFQGSDPPLAQPVWTDFRTVLRRTEAAFLATRESEARMRNFVADASHELRTPLTSLGTAADLLVREAKNDPVQVQRLAKVMRSQADRMERLVEDLLTLARLDLEQESKCEPVHLERLARDHAEELAVAAPEKQVEVQVEPVLIEANPDRLEQVLANLTSNAVRHTQPGGRIRITVASEDHLAVLTVEDDGEGISPEDLPCIFDRFYRADSAGPGGGTGLGLTIVREIVERLGGTVEVSSRPGQGSAFRVKLPVAEQSTGGALGVGVPVAGGLVDLDYAVLLEGLQGSLAAFERVLILLGG